MRSQRRHGRSVAPEPPRYPERMPIRVEPDETQAKAARLRAGILSLAVGTAIFGGKLVAWRLTGSTAVLSDALESVINVVAAALLLASLVIAARPADRDHPYGHGKVEFFSAGVEGTCIAIAAVLIVIEALRAIVRGPSIRNIDVGLAVVVATSLANGLLGAHLVRVGRRHHSLALEADGRHVLADVITSVGVVAGLVAVRVTGKEIFDPLVAIAVAGNILWTGFGLVRVAVGRLMDEAEPERLAAIVEALAAARAPEWIDLHTLRTWRSGHLQHIDFHLTVPRYLDVERLHAIDEAVGKRLSEATGLPTDVIVHFDPCRPRHCSSCRVEACPLREAPFLRADPIDLERALRVGPGELEPLRGHRGEGAA
ncbi:Manganese efflux system protein MneP [Myxococcaceae bacterium]|nr:Manganese efflux system protein MneP [Myxococcaceae bacterium]